ncbi:MAG TPA: (deoxy)nucleoside triphosphate pyrophosphohydrolase [Bryobacteraceae bacterium]|nr:(deoxy)nucleoside triphosphate pyrophosphohydrolase [Bryobacteraceae bacterium]
MIQVVAAILEREGRILICRRRPEQSHSLQWEFPGGKVEAGETPEQALARELQEELGIAGAEGELIASYEYAYPGKAPIRLFFFRVHSYSGEPRNLIFHAMHWEAPGELAKFDFVEGDREFIDSLATGSI